MLLFSKVIYAPPLTFYFNKNGFAKGAADGRPFGLGGKMQVQPAVDKLNGAVAGTQS